MKNYPCLAGGSESSKIIISGNCPPVKQRVIQEQLHRARQKNAAVIIMDYARTGDFSPFLSQNGYPVCHCFTAENNSYTPLDSSLREESLNLRNYAKKMGYSHKEYATMLAFLDFLNRLETKCSSVSSSVGEMLSKFRNQQKFEDFLKKHLTNRTITHKESADFLQTYFEYLEHSIIADVLISEKNFMLNNGGNAFSLSCLRHGETAVLCADKNNSQDTNDFLTEAWTRDIFKIYQNMPLLLIVNGGIHTQIERLYELTETLSHSETGIVYCSYDIFSDCEEKYAENFTSFFDYTLYGRHTGLSATSISRIFGEKWTYKYGYTSGKAEHIRDEWLPFVFSNSDYSLSASTSMTPIKEAVFPIEKIMAMLPNEYIIMDRLSHKFFLASV